MEACVGSQAIPCEICGEQRGLLPNSFVFCQYHLTSTLYSFVIHFHCCVMLEVESAVT